MRTSISASDDGHPAARSEARDFRAAESRLLRSTVNRVRHEPRPTERIETLTRAEVETGIEWDSDGSMGFDFDQNTQFTSDARQDTVGKLNIGCIGVYVLDYK